MPTKQAVAVVTVHVPEVVLPTVTLVVVATPAPGLEVRRMAMVSLLTKPVTGDTPQTPLRAMPVQVLQIALTGPVKPVRVTVLEVYVMPLVALVTSLKLKALGPLADAVVTVQVPDVVPPTVAVAIAAVPALALDVWRMAMVSPATNPATVVPPQLPLRAIAVQLVQVAVREPE